MARPKTVGEPHLQVPIFLLYQLLSVIVLSWVSAVYIPTLRHMHLFNRPSGMLGTWLGHIQMYSGHPRAAQTDFGLLDTFPGSQAVHTNEGKAEAIISKRKKATGSPKGFLEKT